jgi:endonuclease-3
MQDKIDIVYERLVELHGERERIPRREPMHELISTMLSHRTTQQNEATAYKRMRDKFGSWENIRDADTAELAEAIETSNYPEQKAPRVQEVLRRIIEERGEANIDFLAEMPIDEAMAWLTDLPGVGVKTATLVLLFCFGKPVLPVDTHVHRVSQRVGLISEKTNPTAAHDILLAMLPKDDHVIYNYHIALLKHGQKICKWGRPICEKCPLPDICDWYQEHRAQSSSISSSKSTSN